MRSGAPDRRLEHNKIKNPNWQEASSWLFTLVAEDLNSGHTEYKSGKWPERDSNPGPPDCKSDVPITWPRCLHSINQFVLQPFFSLFFSFSSQFFFSRNSTTARAKHSREGVGERGATLTPSAPSFASSEFPAVLIFVRALDYLLLTKEKSACL